MRPEYALSIFEGAATRFGVMPDVPAYRVGLFEHQRAFVDDPAPRKVALCGRRAGKTECVAAWLLDGCEKRPGEVNVYISLSQRHARRILWQTLKRVVARYGVPLKWHEQTLTAETPNGSRIWVTGCDDQAQIEDFRGDRYFRVAIDEAGTFPAWLGYLVDDVLDPALMDLGGELALVGTPGLVPAGYFYDRSDGERPWSVHRWTCLDNPHVPGAAYLAKKRSENQWTETHPTYVREYLGQWVRDDEARIYPYDAQRSAFYELPPDVKWFRVLSVDLGWVDACGFVVGASQRGFPDWWCERAWREEKLTVARIAARIDQVRHDGEKNGTLIDLVVVDAGALGKTIVEDLRQTYGIPCVAAVKSQKLATIHELRGALLAGTAKLNPHGCQHLIAEWSALPWNEDKDDHSELFVDDCSDSALYNFRSHRLHYSPEEEEPAPGSPEWQNKQAQRDKAAAFKRVNDRLKKRFRR